MKAIHSYFNGLHEQTPFSIAQQSVIKETVSALLENETDVDRPAMLLGRIQSGKTRTFIGIIGESFDRGYDVVVVFTKGTKLLARQTTRRLQFEFEQFIALDLVRVYDVMSMPSNLTPYMLESKLIFIVKKEDDNLNRLSKIFFEQYLELKSKQVLIIDDEADFASVGYRSNKDGIKLSVISKQISDFRSGLSRKCDFLQVTATPQSLYLQPDEIVINNEGFKPLRPSFTKIVPIFEGYVGGKFYFEDSGDETSLAYDIYISLPEKEIKVLGKEDRRYEKNILTSDNLSVFRAALSNFIIGGAIRRVQLRHLDFPIQKKYAMVIHTEVGKEKHVWQNRLVVAFFEGLKDSLKSDKKVFSELAASSLANLCASLAKLGGWIPTTEEILEEAERLIIKGHYGLSVINSENDIMNLCDERGQLRLDNPLNIFIGGQILDRGITIDNLIGFLYGRDPKKFQQDTVLQHSRMYGNRQKEDLAVTRFYTSYRIHQVMARMHQADDALRNAIEGNLDGGRAVFLQADQKREFVPCSPNKILLSQTVTLGAGRRLLPVGFTTVRATEGKPILRELDELIRRKWLENSRTYEAIEVEKEWAIKALGLAYKIIVPDEDLDRFNNFEMLASMINILSEKTNTSTSTGKMFVVFREDRNISRIRDGYGFEDSPATSKPGKTAAELTIAKAAAIDVPCLIFIRQNGNEAKGWAGLPFWWPVLVSPQNAPPFIFQP